MEVIAALVIGALVVLLGLDNLKKKGDILGSLQRESDQLDQRIKRDEAAREAARERITQLNQEIEERNRAHQENPPQPSTAGDAVARLRDEFGSH